MGDDDSIFSLHRGPYNKGDFKSASWRPIKNSLHGSVVNNDPLQAKLAVKADFLPSSQVVVKKQDSTFQDWEVSQIPKIYSTVV